MVNKKVNIFDCFEDICYKNGSHIAVTCDGIEYTYSELMAMIRLFDAFLLESGIVKGEKIAFWIDKSIGYIAGIMASIRRGVVFVPLDKKNPTQRNLYIIENSDSKLVIKDDDIEDLIGIKTVKIQDIMQKHSAVKFKDKPDVNESDEAYMIYTSGTTGNPKGVILAQKGLLSLTQWSIGVLSLSTESKITQFASISFDASIWEIFLALLSGAQLHLLRYEITSSPIELSNYIREKEITVAFMPPFMAKLVKFEGTKIKAVITGGCETNLDVCKRIHSFGIDYYNAYGPTENTIITTWWKYDESKVIDGIIPIGKAVPTSSVCILDENRKEVIDGVVGEICITGDMLAKGYYKNEELTKERFVVLNDQMTYMSGDLGYINQNKDIIYVGRNDHQIKIRGFRIELPEIEMQILREFSPQDVKVLAIGNEVNNKALVAFLEGKKKYSQDAIKNLLSEKLPYYMVPSSFVFLDDFPHTINGKIDLKELERIYRVVQEKKEKKMAVTKCQKSILTIWRNILGIQNIGVDEDFFSLGGDSLSYILMIDKIEEIFHKKICLADFINKASIEFIEKLIMKNDAQSEIQVGKRLINTEMLFEKISKNIETTYKQLKQIYEGKVVYEFELSSSQKKMYDKNNISFIDLSEKIKLNSDQEDVSDILTKVINANEVFRTQLKKINGEIKNVVFETIPKSKFDYIDLSAYIFNEEIENVIDTCLEEKLHGKSFVDQLLFLFLVVKVSSREYIVFFKVNHLIFDAASIFVLKKQINMAVKGEITGVRSYHEYVNYLNNCATDNNYQKARKNADNKLATLIRYGKEHKVSNGLYKNEIFEMPIDNIRSSSDLEKMVVDKIVIVLRELFSKDKIMMRVTQNARILGDEDFTNCLGDFHISVPVLITVSDNTEKIFSDIKDSYRYFYADNTLFINEYAYGCECKEDILKVYESVEVGYNFVGLKDDKEYERTKNRLKEIDKVHKNAFITAFASSKFLCIICRIPMNNKEVISGNIKEKLGD